MIPVRKVCPTCDGAGGRWFPTITGTGSDPRRLTTQWNRCPPCDGIGFVWAEGDPGYDCPTTLADTTPGEVVTMGNAEQVRVLWHMPRKTKKRVPDTTFVGAVDPFTGAESHQPVPYPSCVGVRSVDVSRAVVDSDPHSGERAGDQNDPVQRTVAGNLI